MSAFTRGEWDEVAALVADTPEPPELRTDYSGRGMFGEGCVAVVGDLSGLLKFWTAVQYVLSLDGCTDQVWPHELQMDMLLAIRQDSMGTERVYYFPGVTVEG